MGVDGRWYNELGSSTVLETSENQVDGVYETAVGNAQREYPLRGAVVSDPNSAGEAIAWVVAWVNDTKITQSVTAWCGQWEEVEGVETIRATWLLTDETDPADNWASTLVGFDLFTRNVPAGDAVRPRASRSFPAAAAVD